jgi:hypothetical protein
LYTSFLSPTRAACPASLILLYLITRTIFGDEYRSLNSSPSPVTSCLIGPNIPLRTLFSSTRSLRSSLSVGDQVSHSHNTKGKITDVLPTHFTITVSP